MGRRRDLDGLAGVGDRLREILRGNPIGRCPAPDQSVDFRGVMSGERCSGQRGTWYRIMLGSRARRCSAHENRPLERGRVRRTDQGDGLHHP